MTATLAYPYAKTCYECRADFETWDSGDEVCPKCQRDWLRENCPEALADAQLCDEWLDSYAARDYLPTSEE